MLVLTLWRTCCTYWKPKYYYIFTHSLCLAISATLNHHIPLEILPMFCFTYYQIWKHDFPTIYYLQYSIKSTSRISKSQNRILCRDHSVFNIMLPTANLLVEHPFYLSTPIISTQTHFITPNSQNFTSHVLDSHN